MSGSIDDFLNSERSGGSLSDEGSFKLNLREAARKMAVFGQAERALWTLKLGQAFHKLGCRALEITRTSDAWYLEGKGPLRSPDFAVLDASLSKLGLDGRYTAESFLAVGLSALSAPTEEGDALQSCYWVEQGKVRPVLGQVDERPDPCAADNTLVLKFARGRSPALPRTAWENQFSYSVMEIFDASDPSRKALLNNIYSTQFMASSPHLFWLEYLGAGEIRQDLALTPTGRTAASLGEPIPKRAQNHSSRLRWKGTARRAGSIVILASEELRDQTELHPVVAGCLLAPVTDTGLPNGFKIVVTADDCPTDLGHAQLRRGPELEALIDSCKPALQQAVEIMMSTVKAEKSTTVVDKPKTPLVADAAPGCMGCFWLFTIPIVLTEPVAGSLLSAFFGGPPGIYFWYSRRQRNKEFDMLKSEAVRVLESRMHELAGVGN